MTISVLLGDSDCTFEPSDICTPEEVCMRQAPVGDKVYYLQKLRCHLCGALFTAELPEGQTP